MTFAGFRAFIVWWLMIAAIAVVVYWTYYRSLDPQTAASYSNATVDADAATVTGFVDHQRATARSWWHAGTDWRAQIDNALK